MMADENGSMMDENGSAEAFWESRQRALSRGKDAKQQHQQKRYQPI